MMIELEKISIVIPVHNALSHLKELIEALELRYKGLIICLVNDASDAETKEYLHQLCITQGKNKYYLLENERQQLFTRTVNKGIRFLCQEDILGIDAIWILNSDVKLMDQPLEKLIEGMNTDDKLALVGYSDAPVAVEPLVTEVLEPNYVTGHSWLVKTAAFLLCGVLCETDIGGPNTTYPEFQNLKGLAHIGSDREYCNRLRQLGFKVGYVNYPALGHAAGQSWGHRLDWLAGFQLQPLWVPNDRL